MYSSYCRRCSAATEEARAAGSSPINRTPSPRSCFGHGGGGIPSFASEQPNCAVIAALDFSGEI